MVELLHLLLLLLRHRAAGEGDLPLLLLEMRPSCRMDLNLLLETVRLLLIRQSHLEGTQSLSDTLDPAGLIAAWLAKV